MADATFAVIPINQVRFHESQFLKLQILIANVCIQTGRIDFQCCKVIGHNGMITDLKWNPFNDNVIASASDDCTVSNFPIKCIIMHKMCKDIY